MTRMSLMCILQHKDKRVNEGLVINDSFNKDIPLGPMKLTIHHLTLSKIQTLFLSSFQRKQLKSNSESVKLFFNSMPILLIPSSPNSLSSRSSTNVFF